MSLPPLLPEELRNSRAPSLRWRCLPSSLGRARPTPSRRQPLSRSVIGPTQLPRDFSSGRGGFPSFRMRPLSSCRRFHPAGADQAIQSFRRSVEARVGSVYISLGDGSPPVLPEFPLFACPCCLGQKTAGSASGAISFRGHICVHFRYGPTTRSATFRGLCQQATRVRFLSPVLLKLPGFDFYLGGSRPTEHTFHLVARRVGGWRGCSLKEPRFQPPPRRT